MVSSMTKKTISLAISLLVVVISLTGVALGANAPTTPFTVSRYIPGFAGAPGKMARDAAGNFYVTDFWGKGIVKLNRVGSKIGFIATNGRPSAVAVLPDNRLVVAIAKPQAPQTQPYVAFYAQLGVAPNVTGEEKGQFSGTPTVALYRPVGIAIDAAGKIYVLDSGDNSGDMDGFQQILVPASIYRGNVKVYSAAGSFLHEFGNRTYPIQTSTAPYDFKLPQGIAHEKQLNQIVVADTQNGRLQYFAASDGTTAAHVKSVGGTAGLGDPTVGAGVAFYNPVDVAFEYNDSTVLQRVYVAEKGRNQISVFDPATNFYLAGLDGITVSGASMKQPSSIIFERTGTGASTAGVVYTANAATSTDANVMALGLDGGSVPAQTVTMTMAAVPAISSSSPITVTGTTSPGSAVTCKVNGVAGGSPSGTTSWTVSGLVLQAGMNYILCQSATGKAFTEASTFFGATTTAPTVFITLPTAGLYTSNSTVTVTGTTNSGNCTVQLVNSLGGTTTTQSDTNGNWSQIVTLSEGSNLLTATAWKQGTDTSAAATRTVVADFTPPNMSGTISFLNNGAVTNNAVQNLDGIVTDANLLSIEVNGVPVPQKAQVGLTLTTTYFSTPVILDRGKNTVTIKATDKAGLSTTITRGSIGNEIVLKPEIPGLTVALPADNSYRTSAGAVTASGTSDLAFNSVNACGTAVTPASGNWTTPSMNATAGFLSCQFTASGAGVDTVTEKRTINTGASYAQVAITAPPADYATKLSSVAISGSVPAGPTKPQISINGAVPIDVTSYTPGTGAFSHTATFVNEGVYSYKIIDVGGTTAVRNIVYDKTLPELVIQADSKTMPTTITGTIEPSAKMAAITASLSGSPVIIPLSKITFDTYDQSGSVLWKADLNGYAYDAISFTAIDPAVNSVTLAYAKGIPTGDIDGDGTVRLADALAALRHVAGTETINPVSDSTKFFNGDVGGLIKGRASRDGVIDISDSVLILNKAYGLMAF